MKMLRRGFTIVEIIIALAIMGGVALIATPSISGVQNRSNVKSDILIGGQIGQAFVIKEIKTGNKGEALNKQIRYSESANIGIYISRDYKPDSMKDGYYVVSQVEIGERKVALVGITRNDEVIPGNALYDGGEPGWVWCSAGNLSEFLAKNGDKIRVEDPGDESEKFAIIADSNAPNGITDQGRNEVNKGGSKTFYAETRIETEDAIYTFDHWIRDGVRVTDASTSISFSNVCENHTIEAVYEETKYILKYDPNGGDGAPTEQTGIIITISATKPTREGYTFAGWGTSSSSTSATYTVGDSIILTADTTLYAVWEEISIPTLMANSTWHPSDTEKSTITQINIVNRSPSTVPDNSWAADVAGNGDIICYIEGTTLTIAGNGADKIYANTNSSNMFSNFDSLISIEGLDILDTSKVTGMYGMFYNCKKLKNVNLSQFNTENVVSMSYIFGYCNELTEVTFGNNFNTSKVKNMNGMFYDCISLTGLDVSRFDTSNVTNMGGMFNDCRSLTSLDVSNFDTSNVTNMNNMFDQCSGLTSLDVSSFDTSNVKDMGSMFSVCTNLTTLTLGSNFNTANVQSMRQMFLNDSSLTNLDVSGFDTANVTDMTNLFSGCSSLTSLDLSNFNTKSVKYEDISTGGGTAYSGISGMFSGMIKLQEITLGANFSFTGNGSTSCILPTPSSTYITGADGKWYNTAGTAYLPANVPSKVANTYYAVGKRRLASVANVGDYVTYAPSSTSYTVPKTVSGYTSNQTYDPSSITSWRVFSKNGNNVEIISTNSVGNLALNSKVAFINYVQTLQDMATAYVNPAYATSGRSFGYNESGITDVANYRVINTNEYPLVYKSTGFPYNIYNAAKDFQIMQANPSLITGTNYIWVASREFRIDEEAAQNIMYIGILYTDGNMYIDYFGGILNSGYEYANGTTPSRYFRPIVTLKPELLILSGEGTEANPYVVTESSTSQYTITYCANEGYGTMNPQSVSQGSSLTLNANEYEIHGDRRFKGWAVSATGEVAYSDKETIKPEKDMTLYAIWSSCEHTWVPESTTSNCTVITISTCSSCGESKTETTTNHVYTIKEYYYKDETYCGYACDCGITSQAVVHNWDDGTALDGMMVYECVRCRGEKIETIEYTLTYNANGGSGTMATQTVLAGNTLTLSSNVYAKSGYYFLGWSESSTATSPTYTNRQTITPTRDMTLYAVWEEIQIPTLMVSNTWYQSDIAKSTITQINIVDSYILETTPNDSWVADDDGSGDIMCYIEGTKLTIAGNGARKIYANEDSTIAFLGFSGATTISGINVLDTSNVEYMSGMFENCSSLVSLDVSNFDTSNVIDMDDMFSYCSSLVSLDVSSFNTSNLETMAGMFYEMNRLQEITLGANFRFLGSYLPTPSNTYIPGANGKWYNTEGTAYLPENIPNNVADTYYAVGSNGTTYTITYDANGGIGTMEPQIVTPGETISLSVNKFIKEGYEFIGWSRSNRALVASFSEGEEVRPESSGILYAIWKESTSISENTKKTITLTYDANGGSGEPVAQSTDTTSGTVGFTISSVQPIAPEGKAFRGWSTDPNATVANYKLGGYIELSSARTLYAVYYENPMGEGDMFVGADIGAYVKYLPTKTNYTVFSDLSGADDNQTYNPSSYTNWRVFSNNGTNVEIISDDRVGWLYLGGSSGYINAVQILQEMSEAYINSAYAISARSFGYSEEGIPNGQDGTKDVANYRTIDINKYPLSHGVGGFPYDSEYLGYSSNGNRTYKQPYSDDREVILANLSLWHGGIIWVPARSVGVSGNYTHFCIRAIGGGSGVPVGYELMCHVPDIGYIELKDAVDNGVLPIIKLKSTLKVSGGDGSPMNPYRITN